MRAVKPSLKLRHNEPLRSGDPNPSLEKNALLLGTLLPATEFTNSAVSKQAREQRQLIPKSIVISSRFPPRTGYAQLFLACLTRRHLALAGRPGPRFRLLIAGRSDPQPASYPNLSRDISALIHLS